MWRNKVILTSPQPDRYRMVTKINRDDFVVFFLIAQIRSIPSLFIELTTNFKLSTRLEKYKLKSFLNVVKENDILKYTMLLLLVHLREHNCSCTYNRLLKCESYPHSRFSQETPLEEQKTVS